MTKRKPIGRLSDTGLRLIAERVVRELFTSGGRKPEICDRLVLTTKDGRDLGGWCEGAIADKIFATLLIVRSKC